ncbi:hypothetical protein DRJ17_03960 [Candidatus Woesearchaeota archaeon]|nr:MAG: hypothetical protein DRJ17_03960 [Candidatus Woesearchaeota archaeon]
MTDIQHTTSQFYRNVSIDHLVTALANGSISPVLVLATSRSVSSIETEEIDPEKVMDIKDYHRSSEIWHISALTSALSTRTYPLKREYVIRKISDNRWEANGVIKSRYINGFVKDVFNDNRLVSKCRFNLHPILRLVKSSLETTLKTDTECYLQATVDYINGTQQIEYYIAKAGRKLTPNQRERALFTDRYLKKNGILGCPTRLTENICASANATANY